MKKALELFSTKGYDATSVREICEAAGITKPTLYHFYGSKEGVYRALVDGALEGFRAATSLRAARRPRARRSSGSSAWPAATSRSRREHRELMRFIFGLIHNPPSSAPRTDFPRFYESVVSRDRAAWSRTASRDGSFAPGPTDVRMLVFMGALGEALCGSLISAGPSSLPSSPTASSTPCSAAGARGTERAP